MTSPHHAHPPRRTAADLARGTAAALILLAVIAGLPWLLWSISGSPLPGELPGREEIRTALTRRDEGQLFLATLTYLVWAGWAVFTILVVLEVPAQLRRRPAPRIPGLGPVQQLSGVLVASVAVLVLGPPIPLTRADTPVPAPLAAVALQVSSAPIDNQPAGANTLRGDGHGPTPQTAADKPVPKTYVVQPRDTLWGIAERLLGNGERYIEIADLNYGHPQPDGRALTDAHWIYPGWSLRLPADAATPDRIGGPYRRYTVQPGDTLWDIAGRHLGDPTRHPEIYNLNAGHRQPDGEILTDPDLIRPGWTLLLPAPGQPTPVPLDASEPEPSKDETSSAAPTTSADSSAAAPPVATPTITPSPSEPPIETPAFTTTPEDIDDESDRPREILTLPSGAVVGISLAVAIGTALAAARLHRRRHRISSDDGSLRQVSEGPPVAAVRALRRAHLAATAAGGTPADLGTQPTVAPFPGITGPVELVVGARDEQEIRMPLAGLNIGLTGSGATDTARALLVGLLADASNHRAEILLPSTDAARLLARDTDDLDALAWHLPGLTTTPRLDDAVTRLEVELVRRARLLDTDPTDDITNFRAAHPDEPVPGILLIATPDPAVHHRVGAILALGATYDIGAVLLADWPHGTTCHLETDGRVDNAAGPDADRWRGTQFFHLSAADLTEMIRVLRAAHGAEEPAGPAEGAGSAGAQHAGAPGPTAEYAIVDARQRPVRLTVLGPPRIDVNDREIATGLRSKARELLAFLTLHPDGATRDAIIDALWPDLDIQRAAMLFHTAARDIRKLLRETTRATGAAFIILASERYRLDPNLIDVDLWQHQAALAGAVRAADDGERGAALQRAADLYRGDLADGQPYEWAEPDREALRRQAVDALTSLARLRESTDPEAAMSALEQALRVDPYAEEIYRRVMALQTRLGRRDAARRTYRRLETRLADLDTEPDDQTQRLLATLQAGDRVQSRTKRPDQQ
jgi:DNA-binding SARP family transcriptional activator/LysM repeat protein